MVCSAYSWGKPNGAIRHGNYFTVYSNLIGVQVKSGDILDLKQPIGTAFTDEEGKTMVQFGIWKDANIQDPSLGYQNKLTQMKRIFYLSTCDTCKRILNSWNTEGIYLQDIKTETITPAQLDNMITLAGSVDALFSKRARKYKSST